MADCYGHNMSYLGLTVACWLLGLFYLEEIDLM